MCHNIFSIGRMFVYVMDDCHFGCSTKMEKRKKEKKRRKEITTPSFYATCLFTTFLSLTVKLLESKQASKRNVFPPCMKFLGYVYYEI